jgi:hypothetical protein
MSCGITATAERVHGHCSTATWREKRERGLGFPQPRKHAHLSVPELELGPECVAIVAGLYEAQSQAVSAHSFATYQSIYRPRDSARRRAAIAATAPPTSTYLQLLEHGQSSSHLGEISREQIKQHGVELEHLDA